MQELRKTRDAVDSLNEEYSNSFIRTLQFLQINYLSKMKGEKKGPPLPYPSLLESILTWLGSFLGIIAITLFAHSLELPVVASFGASAVLIYGVPDAPLSQPRNVVLGHTLSAAVGVATVMVFGLTWWSPALGTALALVVMLLTKTTHPPGGATALFAVLSQAEPIYIFTPIMVGAIILVIIGVLVNNLSPKRRYPKYWY